MKNIEFKKEREHLNVENGEDVIVCPICKDYYTHFDYDPEITPAETYLSQHRGGGITIPMWCEQGHYWDLVISHHKGNSYITNTNFKQRLDE